MTSNGRFQPRFNPTYLLNSRVAEDAIRAYNSDPSVARDEEKAYQHLGLGFPGPLSCNRGTAEGLTVFRDLVRHDRELPTLGAGLDVWRLGP